MENLMANQQYDAVVVGSGVIGASLALALSQKTNWRIALIEKGESTLDTLDQFDANQRVTALGLSAKNLLSQLNVWQNLNVEQTCSFERMFVWDEGTDAEIEFLAHDYAAESLGYMVDHYALQSLLHNAIKGDSKISEFYSSQIIDLTLSDGLSNHLGDQFCPADIVIQSENDESKKTKIKANWVFAADGINSLLRQQADIQVRQHAYQQKGIVARIQTEYPHQFTAWQRFLSTGPIALLPLSNGQCSIVWTLGNSECDRMLALDDHSFSKRIETALQSRLGKIELCSNRQVFPLQSKHAESYLKGNLVLVGDAAHGIHPLAGQGANLGFGDINSILDAIGSLSSTDLRMRRVLRRFERQQKLENYSMDSLMTGLESIFASENVVITSLRRLGMKSLNASTLPKSLLAARMLNR
jgi:2-octaprenylphenol hydroxylase